MNMAISKERLEKAFADSVSFSEYLDHAQNHVEEMRDKYANYVLSEKDIDELSGITDEVHVLAISEDWCPDCTATVPLFARVDEAVAPFHLHVLVREPGNGDVGAAYPAGDGRSHIPTYVFFDKDLNELGVFIERPEAISALLDELRADFARQHEEVDPDNFIASLTPELRAQFGQRVSELRRANEELEKKELLQVIKNIAASKVSA